MRVGDPARQIQPHPKTCRCRSGGEQLKQARTNLRRNTRPLFRNRNDGPGFTRPESYHHRYFWWLHREGASQQILENLSQPVRIGAYDSLVDDDCAKKAVAELTRD
jgi:hypothetical protein